MKSLRRIRLGIMQGRLSPPIDGRIQAFPAYSWEQEFAKAGEIGFDFIEMIFDIESIHLNPLTSVEGIDRVRELIKSAGVDVLSICADYFMRKPFYRSMANEREEAVQALIGLIELASRLNVRNIVIPCLEESEIRSIEEKVELKRSLSLTYDMLDKAHINLALETSLQSKELRELMLFMDHPRVTINYDIGNSASLGFDPSEEIDTIGPWITHVHIKDRRKSGGTVPLGQGDADFQTIFRKLLRVKYQGAYVIQGARQADEVETAKEYLNFVTQIFHEIELSR